MQYFFGLIIFLFGSALGSFIAVIASRYNTGLAFFKGRSFCFSCNTELGKRDLFPILSFLFLKGRCRYCQSKIPKETLMIELIMGLLSVLAAFKSGLIDNFQFSPSFDGFNFQFLIGYFLIVAIFATILLISIYDLKHFIIPDAFLVFLFIFSFIYLLVPTFFNFSLLLTTCYLLLLNIISGIVVSLPFLLIFLISRGTWFGFGDVKYIAVIGFFLSLSGGLSATILSFWIGAVFSLLIISFNRLKSHIGLPLFKNSLTIKSEIPFGPFLSLGTIISFYFSLDIFQINALFF